MGNQLCRTQGNQSSGANITNNVQTLIVDVQPDVNVKPAMNADKAGTKKIIRVKRVEGKAVPKSLSAPGIARKGQVIRDDLRNSATGISVNVPTGTSVKLTGNVLRNTGIGISVNVPAGTSAKVTCNGLRNSEVGILVNVPTGTSVKVTRHSDTMKEIGASSKSSVV